MKLLIAVGGIYASYIYSGVITERLFSEDYSGLNREKGTYQKFSYGFATTIFQSLFAFIIAVLINRLHYKRTESAMDFKSQMSIALISFCSGTFANQALIYLSYPIQSIMKSSKILSILIVALVLRIKGQHTKSQYFCGLIITTGIVLFNFTTEKGGKHEDQGTSLVGIIAVTISLFFDGLLGVFQDKAMRKFKPDSWDLMESVNKWSLILSLFYALVNNQMMEFIEYVGKYPAVIPDLVLLSVLGTMGKVFIFYTIANFSSLVLSIVTTTRKLFTVLISIAMFNHNINFLQWMSIALVFVGVFVEMISGMKKGKSKPKSGEMAREEAQSQQPDSEQLKEKQD